ncbi:CidA/LrgA family protein [Bacillus sp. FJAT-29814]|uniref:CidA/LrgA family protein n=1 Tax=Bacillus sp. FJAT-29814 TaxID=1729688 RepID=UPI000830AE6A|nr:CidA/LrgA family protein [Bacillus sp. FJAT-29814]
MKFGVIILQVLLIHIFLFLGAAAKAIIPLPIPASMFGLAILFLALCLKIVKLEWVEKGANWLMAELLLFFIPSAVGIVNYDEILSFQGAEIVFLIGISTILVMGMTAWIAEKIIGKKRGGQHDDGNRNSRNVLHVPVGKTTWR